MGYRSNIFIKVSDKAYPKVMSVIEETQFAPHQNLTNEEGNHLLFYEWVKWSSWYYDVPKIMESLRSLNENEGEYFGFLRVGEESGDIEHEFNNFDFDIETELKVHIEDFEEARIRIA